jgi:pSer/pThr/pTyr-binding forkhead associated (FHA) protein
VSRRHARIQRQRTQFFIEDLGSANGTFLNGQRLTPYLPHPLHDGDDLQIGRIRLQVGIH